MKKVLIFALLLALLCGCAKELPAYELPSGAAEPTASGEPRPAETREQERFNTYPVDLDVDALLGHTDHEIVFLQGKYAQYYDLELHRAFAFCSQPNCSHSDESCPSYFGGDSAMETDYAVVGDSIYAILTENETTLRLRRLKPLTGEKRDLFTETLPDLVQDTAEDGTPRSVVHHYSSVQLQPTGSALILQYHVWRDVTLYEKDRQRWDGSAEHVVLRYDIPTGELRELYRGAVPIYYEAGTMFQGAGDGVIDAGDRFVLWYADPAVPPTTLEEHLKSGGSEEDYSEYMSGYARSSYESGRVLLWDLETDEKTPICARNDLRMDSSYALYRHTVCFLKHERELWRLDLKDGSQTKLLELDMPGVLAMVEQWDGRVIFNMCRELEDGTFRYDWYWYELATGELRQFQKEGGVCKFSIIGETDRYLIGYTPDGGAHVLSKQDYYNENYDAYTDGLGSLLLVR